MYIYSNFHIYEVLFFDTSASVENGKDFDIIRHH